MRLEFSTVRERFEAITSFDERHGPKAAGFRWDSGVHRWCTTSALIAVKLADHADEDTRRIIEGRLAAELAQRAADEAAKSAAIEASRAADAEIDIPAPEGLEYLPYQRAGIAYALDKTDVLVGDEMGLGKTIMALGIVNADASIKRVALIVPAYLKINWQREASRWLVRPMSVGIASSKVVPDTDVVIVNYDLLSRPAVAAALRERAWDCLVFDEAHYLKNSRAQRTMAALGDAKAKIAPIPARRRVYLTGTPILNRPVELWPILKAAGLFTDFVAYARRYCAAYRDRYGLHPDGASNLDELQEILRAKLMIRRLKADVLRDLPPKTRQVIEIEPEGEAAKAVAAERAAFAACESEIKALEARVRAADVANDKDAYRQAVRALTRGRLAAFTQIAVQRHRTALAKVPYVIDYVRSVLDDGVPCVLVFTHHRDVAAEIAAAFGGDAALITGEMSPEARMAEVDAVQAGTKRVCVGTIGAAGVGLTLTAAPVVLFAELDWTPGRMAQAEDRAHRIGQQQAVLVQHVVLSGSIDAEMAVRLVDKADVIARALDEPDVEDEEPTTTGGETGEEDARHAA